MIYINDNKAIDFRHVTIEDNRSEAKRNLRMSGNTMPTRRATVCDIVEVIGEKPYKIIASGMAKCDSRDNYNKERGRKTALKLALKNAGMSRNERTRVWDAYWSR